MVNCGRTSIICTLCTLLISLISSLGQWPTGEFRHVLLHVDEASMDHPPSVQVRHIQPLAHHRTGPIDIADPLLAPCRLIDGLVVAVEPAFTLLHLYAPVPASDCGALHGRSAASWRYHRTGLAGRDLCRRLRRRGIHPQSRWPRFRFRCRCPGSSTVGSGDRRYIQASV